MGHWQKIIIFTMVLVMPVSSWANILIGFHYQTSDTSSHTMACLTDDGQQHVHMGHQVASDESKSNVGCKHKCSGLYDCSVSGCNATALLVSSEIKFRVLTQVVGQFFGIAASAPDPHTLFRPPISLS